jgi:hypothetical protein
MLSLRRIHVVLLFVALPLFAQTTGTLTGTTSLGGNPLPGVTVTISGPSLQGTRVAVTDPNGNYTFGAVPPGDYKVLFTMESMSTVTRSVRVGLASVARADAEMRMTAAVEVLTVTAKAPLIETSSAATKTNYDERSIETLPTGRNYTSVVQVTPGVSTDASNNNGSQSTITVYGSSGAENSYFIDGVNTTGVEYGFQGKELNFEFIKEIDVKTGGYEAEFGRSTGGVINVITKSGGNELRGDVFTYHDSDSLQTSAKSVISTATTAGFTRKDYGLDLGGYILKDKLWFFGAYDRVQNTVNNEFSEGPLAGQGSKSSSRHNLGSGKLTYTISPGQTLVGTFLQDPRVDTGAINDSNHSLLGDPSTYLGRQDFGGRDYAFRYDGALSSNWIITGQTARHRETNSVGPATSAGDAIQYRDASNDFFQTGGFGLIQDKRFDRKPSSLSVEHYFGRHDLKGGIEVEEQTANVTKRMSGGQQVDVFTDPADATKKIYRHFYWTTPDATVGNAPLSALNATPKHRNNAVYLQDRWSLNEVTINAGIRWDRQRIIDASGVTQIDMKKDYAPRLGVTWSPKSRSQDKVYASYGRYYEEIPMDLVIRSFSYERQPRIINFSPTSNVPDAAAEKDFGTASAILGGFTEPSDPHIKNQYLTEYIAGYEREVMPDLAVGVKGIYRSYGRIIEDFLCVNDGTYCIGNPGEGIMKRIFTLDYSTTYPAPKPKRTYKGVQFDATKRFSNNWQAMASYIYSKLDGNYDGEFAPFTNVGADPNISAAYDYFDFFTNGSDLTKITNHGPLSNDRRNQFKASGVYETPWKISLGAAAYWRSGTPVTRYGYSDAYGRYEFFLTSRGAEGRTPSNYDLDLHVGYPIAVGTAKVNLLLDVFNLLDTQRAVLLDERWGFSEADNASITPVNPGYKRPVIRTAPTSARLGVRISF